VWYAKYRLPDGRQRQRRIGPAWTSRGRPQAGCFTKRTAEAWLSDVLEEARRGTLAGMLKTGATFADAADEYLSWLERDRERKPSTMRDYRSIVRVHLLPSFRNLAIPPIRGHDGLRAFAREATEHWERYRNEVTDLLRRGRLALAVGRFRARGRSSGVEIEAPMYWVTERNDAGKVIWARSFVDLDDALASAAQRDATTDATPRA
jgi:hypothetical protein